MKFFNKTIKLLFLMPIIIGTFSLSKFAHSEPQCEIDEYSLLSYLVNGDKVCGKFLSSSDIVSVVKVLDAYWDPRNMTRKGIFKLLSDGYKTFLKKAYGLKNESEYLIPLSAYERFFHGYHIRKIQSYSDKSLQITMNIQWSQEGYQGTITYIFDMVNMDDIWVISRITSGPDVTEGEDKPNLGWKEAG